MMFDPVSLIVNVPLLFVISYYFWRMLDGCPPYWRMTWLFGIYYVLQFVIGNVLANLAGVVPQWVIFVNLGVELAAMTFTLKLLSTSKYRKIVLYQAVLMIIIGIMSFAGRALAVLLYEGIPDMTAEMEEYVWSAAAGALQIVAVFAATELICHFNRNISVDVEGSAYLGVIVMQAVMLLTIAYYQFRNALSISAAALSLITVALCARVDLRLVRAFRSTVKNAELEEEIRSLERQQSMRHEHYQAVAAQLNEIRNIRHDLHNTFSTIEQLIGEGAYESASALAFETDGAFSAANTAAITGNPVVDAVLYVKGNEARARGIRFDCALALPENANLTDREWMSILSNLVDNAIEYCESVDKDTAPSIEVFARTQGRMLKIGVSNTFFGSAAPDVNAPVTTKPDGEKHGCGLRIVRRIAAAHGGGVYAELSDRLLTVAVLIDADERKES